MTALRYTPAADISIAGVRYAAAARSIRVNAGDRPMLLNNSMFERHGIAAIGGVNLTGRKGLRPVGS
jgi:hypothetical protein